MTKERLDIHGPRCGWRPQAEDRRECTPSCGTAWNTFRTRGVCPGCGVKWPGTQCLECQRFSPHEAWYHYPRDVEENGIGREEGLTQRA